MIRGIIALLSMTRVPRLFLRLMSDRRVPFILKLIPIAAILYAVLPIDIIPDALPFLGRIDDLLILIGAPLIFLATAPRDIVAEHLGRGNTTKQGTNTRPANGDNVIDGEYRVFEDE